MHLIIFKTSVATKKEAQQLQPLLNNMPLIKEHNFDLDDCDNILRVVSTHLQPELICELLDTQGFNCEALESFIYAR
ncbi:hypothetical protein OQY15_00045 [Pedobacter sp. MC2016-15]|uniref:hypothetical protein n=1 Tax=Pedobacter sp. MC2016-15 TaxID=2994473 RepID=UPI0022469369|nr:hypothetical protein [Pedobacter sp. MC2016-15]MCX2477458.1 hypothetical protein [Pedobacter sp. MC2016-15]